MTRRIIRLAVEIMDAAHDHNVEESFLISEGKKWIDGLFPYEDEEKYANFSSLMDELQDKYNDFDIYKALMLLEELD